MTKNIRFVLLLIQTFIDRHRKYLILGAICGFFFTLFFLSIYSFYAELLGPKNKKIGVVGRYTESILPLSIQNQISLGLTALTGAGEATASLARSWEIDAKEVTYTFYLHPNIFWHDGKRFTAEDVNYKLKGATFIPINETTIQVSLKEPYSPLPVVVSRPILKANLNGVGMYKVAKIKNQGEIISELTLQPQKRKLPTLIYKFYSSVDEAVLSFKLGEVDIIQNISEVGDLANWKNARISDSSLYDRFVGLFFNLKNPLFKEKDIRHALAFALPKFENVETAYSPISPLSWAYSAKIRLYDYDPSAAVKILAKNQISSSSTQLTITTYASLLTMAQTIAEAWNKVGLNVKVKVESAIPSDYQILLITQPIPPDPDQYQYWQSTQEGTNLTHYFNLKIDKLLEDGRRTLDKEKRIKIYADFQRYLVDDAPVIFLYYPKVYTVERR